MLRFDRRKSQHRKVAVCLAFLICCASASTVEAESADDEGAVLAIESLKDSVIGRLAECETKGRPDAGRVVIVDTNNEVSIGKLQFQPNTVVNYTKLIEGRAIDRKEAIRIALDEARASNLAKKIIFEKDGLGNWHGCSRKLKLAPEVKRIRALMR